MSTNEYLTKKPTLDHVNVDLRWAQTGGVMYVTVSAQGRCDRRRNNLWTFSETYQVVGASFSLMDRMMALGQALETFRPSNQTEMDRVMLGNLWQEDTLPGMDDGS